MDRLFDESDGHLEGVDGPLVVTWNGNGTETSISDSSDISDVATRNHINCVLILSKTHLDFKECILRLIVCHPHREFYHSLVENVVTPLLTRLKVGNPSPFRLKVKPIAVSTSEYCIR